MNLPSVLDAGLCVRLVMTLAHFLWQAAAVALVAGAVTLVLRRASAQVRYVVLVVALVLMVAAPVVTFALLSPPVATTPPPAPPAPPVEVPPVTTPGPFGSAAPAPGEPAVPEAPPAVAPTPTPSRSFDWSAWTRFAPQVTLAYLAGVALMLIRLSLALAGGSRLRRVSEPVGDSGMIAAFQRMARTLGLRVTPAVAFCREVAAPTVVGVFRPMVLLPVLFATGLSAEQVEAVFAHELAHIRRYDYLVNVFQRLVEAGFFFHPAVWWVSRRIRAEREHCCDDAVLAVGVEPRAYAESLVVLAERSLAFRGGSRLARVAALGAADRPSSLRMRVLRLLGGDSGEPVRLARAWPVLLLILGAVLLAITLGVRTLPQPTEKKETAAVPELKFIALDPAPWDASEDIWSKQEYWYPDGRPGDLRAERLVMHTLSGRFTTRPSKVLGMWFSLPGNEWPGEWPIGKVEILDEQGNRVTQMQYAESIGSSLDGQHWYYSRDWSGNQNLPKGQAWIWPQLVLPAQELPGQVDVRLTYSGPWEKDAARFFPDGTVRGELPAGCRFIDCGTRQDPGAGLENVEAYMRIIVPKWSPSPRMDLKLERVLKEGRALEERAQVAPVSADVIGTVGKLDPTLVEKGLAQADEEMKIVYAIGFKIEEVAYWRLDVRRYHTVTFRNVSLKAGHKTDFKAPPSDSPAKLPLAVLTAHRFYEQGKTVRVRFETRASAWKPTMWDFDDNRRGRTYFVRIDGKDYFSSTRWGPFGGENNAGFSENLKLGAITGTDLKFSLGKHRACLVYKDIDAVDPAAPGKPVHYDELTTNEVEFEVVEKLPEGYLKPVYEAGWDALLKEKVEVRLTDHWDDHGSIIENNFSLDHPDLLWVQIGALPFDTAFDVYAEPEGGERRKVGDLSIRSGSAPHGFLGYFADDRLTWENAKERKWRLVFVPSAETAMVNPPITTYYGREFTTDWQSFKPSKSYDETMKRRKAFLAAKAATEPAWGKAVDGLRCRWTVPKGPIIAGSYPTLTVEIENSSDKEILWQCSSETTWGINIAPASAAREALGHMFPKSQPVLGKGVRPATHAEVQKTFGIEVPGLGPGDAVPGCYALGPGGRMTLTCQWPQKLTEAGDYRVDCLLARVNLMGNIDYPLEIGTFTCPPIAIRVSAAPAFEGAFTLDRDIPAAAELWQGPVPPVIKERRLGVATQTVRFERKGDKVEAVVTFGHLSWPKRTYDFSILLFDKTAALSGATRVFTTSGEILTYPLWLFKTEVRFTVCPWEEAQKATRFRLAVFAEDVIAWGKEVAGLQLGLAYDGAERAYHAGETVKFKLLLRNKRDKPATLIDIVPAGGLVPAVVDAMGKDVPLRYVAIDYVVPARWSVCPPGATLEIAGVTLQLLATPTAETAKFNTCAFLKPGTYRVRQTHGFMEDAPAFLLSGPGHSLPTPKATWSGSLTTGDLTLTVAGDAAAEKAAAGTCRVSGTLVTESGRAVPKGNVTLTRVGQVDGKAVNYSAETDDKGAFAFDKVVPGAYTLRAIGPYLNVAGGMFRRENRYMDLDVRAGQAEKQLRVQLLSWQTKVRVTLLDPEGKPVSDAAAYMCSFERYYSTGLAPVKTDHGGVFEISCDPQQSGTAHLVVPARQLWTRFTFKPGEADKVLALTAKCTLGGTLQGRVVEKGTERGAGGIYVSPKAPGFTEDQPFPLCEEPPAGSDLSSVSRDGDGAFRIVLPTGDYVLRSENLSPLNAFYVGTDLPPVPLDHEVRFTIRPGETTDKIDLRVEPFAKAGTLRGRVVDAQGKPVPRQLVHLSENDRMSFYDFSRHAVTDGAGRFAVYPLPPREYDLRVARPNELPGPAVGVDLKAGGETAEVKFQLSPPNPAPADRNAVPKADPPGTWGVPVDGFHARITPAAATFDQYGPMTLTLEVQNVDRLARPFDPQALIKEFRGIRPDDKPLCYVHTPYQTLSTNVPKLGYQETKTFTLVLSSEWDTSMPGEYRVQFRGPASNVAAFTVTRHDPAKPRPPVADALPEGLVDAVQSVLPDGWYLWGATSYQGTQAGLKGRRVVELRYNKPLSTDDILRMGNDRLNYAIVLYDLRSPGLEDVPKANPKFRLLGDTNWFRVFAEGDPHPALGWKNPDGDIRRALGLEDKAAEKAAAETWGPAVDGVHMKLVAEDAKTGKDPVPKLVLIIENTSDHPIWFERGGGELPEFKHAWLTRSEDPGILRMRKDPRTEPSPFGPSSEGVPPGKSLRLEPVSNEALRSKLAGLRKELAAGTPLRVTAITTLYTSKEHCWHLTSNSLEIGVTNGTDASQKADAPWGEAVEGVRLGLVMTRHEFAPNEPIIVRMQLMKADATAKLPQNSVNLSNVWLSCRIKGEAFEGGTMYLGPEAPPVKVKDVGVGEVFYSTELDLQKALGFVPRINTTYEVALEYLIRWGGGTRGTRVKSAPVTMRLSVPEDKVVDYYISELLAERPREIARRYGDNIRPYPVDELVKLGRPAVVKLEALLRESDEPGTRERAVGALGYFGAHAELAVPAMREALKDEGGDVRRESIIALARVGPAAKDAIPDLVGLLTGGLGMGDWAGKALTAIGPAAAPSLLDAMKDNDKRLQAVVALAQMENLPEQARTPLLDVLKDKDDRVRVWAGKALWKITRNAQEVIPVFVAALASREETARLHAAIALSEIGPGALQAIPALREALEREQVDYVRRVMSEALEKLMERAAPGGAGKPEDAAWGEAVDGVQVRLVADRIQWKLGEIPTFKAEVRNEGKREVYLAPAQELVEVEVDKTWYRWGGEIDVRIRSGKFGPGQHYKDIVIALGGQWVRWVSKPGGKPLELKPGKHVVRVAMTGEPVDRKTEKPVRAESNPVEIEVLPAAPAAQPTLPHPVLEDLGARLTIRVEADSWNALVEEVKPTFTWGGRDMMWIGKDEEGNPQFALDRAYVYKPKGRPTRWVLLTHQDAPHDKPWAAFSGSYLPGVARLHTKVPETDHGCGEYAVTKSTDPKGGTVYEIGWQSTMSGGTGLDVEQRRLFVLQDDNGKWHFVGEGPDCTSGKMGYASANYTAAQSRVIWTGTVDAPVRIEFTVRHVKHEWATSDEPGFVPRRDRVEFTEAVLDGQLPTTLRWTTRRPYMLAQTGDTHEGIVRHLATWTIGWVSNRGDDRQNIVKIWGEALAELNPGLPHGEIPEGTQIRLLTYPEIIEHYNNRWRVPTQPGKQPGGSGG